MVSIYSHIASDARLALVSRDDLPPRDTTEEPQNFEIHDIRRSENAVLFFNSKYVFKLLQPYDDCRYSLKESAKRRECLIEGLHCNRSFTDGIQLGLARFCGCDWKHDKLSSINIGEIKSDPVLEELDPNAEYVLVMQKLHQKHRLDMLLKEGNSISLQYYEQVLTQFMCHLHINSTLPVNLTDNTQVWGSVAQLEQKLRLNLTTVEKPGDDVKSKPVLHTDHYKRLLSTCKSLRQTLLPVFSQEPFSRYFLKRVDKGQIKHCHGDLKARNIWILPSSDNSNAALWDGVRVLDAIDFNPAFCNIDTLSDFAMLVTDIHARTNLESLADRMVESYLRLTNQLDQADRFILNYYLVEKAFVGSFVCILYDDQLTLGKAYLDVTERYLAEFKQRMHATTHVRTVFTTTNNLISVVAR